MPKNFEVRILDEAERDLDEISDYIFENSPQNARSVKEGIRSAIRSLEIFPGRSKKIEENADPAKIVYSMPVWPFVVYYRVVDVGMFVEVLMVRHGARDRPQKFFG